MLGKTLILGLISAGAAGAVVYYGTAPTESGALESGVSKAVQAENRITPRLPTVRKVEPKDTREKLASSEWMDLEELKAKAGITDAETKSVTPEANPEANEEASKGVAAGVAPKKQMRWLDQYLKNNKDEQTTEVDADGKMKPQHDKAHDKMQAKPAKPAKLERVEKAEAPKAALPNVDAPKLAPPKTAPAKTAPAKTAPVKTETQSYFRIEDGKLVEIGSKGEVDAVAEREDKTSKPQGKKHKQGEHKKGMKTRSQGSATNGSKSHGSASDGSSSHGSANKPSAALSQGSAYAEGKVGDKHVTTARKIKLASDSSPIIATVMKEAAQIKKNELRDQAYFEITEYALSEGRFESARAAHDLIEQDELAYTAKSRIAVAYAHNGEPTKAFKAINEVEEEELRDFMRLQVIEALIAPQKLPESWQKQN